MKRKICYIIAMLLVMTFAGNAQKTVFQNLTWEQAAELAQKENKIILVDAMRKPATAEARKQKDKEEAVWQKVVANLNFVNSMWWPSVSIWLLRLGRVCSEIGDEYVSDLWFFMPNGDILGMVSPFLLAKNPELFLKEGKRHGSSRSEEKQQTFHCL
ncbi:MAG: hypothetical protein ACLTHQ_07780 [Odoribacter splanchnicus]